MSYEQKDHIFLYNGYALGAGGFVEIDDEKFYVNAPSSVLSITGGGRASDSGKVSFSTPRRKGKRRFFLTIGKVETEVTGEERDGSYVTTTLTTVRKLNVNDVLTADVLTAHTQSVHKKPKKDERAEEAAVLVLPGSDVKGLKINGKRSALKRDEVAMRIDTLVSARAACDGKGLLQNAGPDGQREFRRRNYLDADDQAPLYVRDIASQAARTQSTIRYSIFESLTIGRKEMPSAAIEIPDFGRIFFGEVFVTEGMKRLAMIRLDLGCSNCGSLTIGQNATNGETFP